MGLDMYAFISSAKPEDVKVANDTDGKELPPMTQLKYWRKHADLHGWFENQWQLQGNTEEFNCEFLEVTDDMLRQLEIDLANNNFDEARGFFWGSSSEEDWEDTIDFITKAKTAIEDGWHVYYYSWW